MNEEPTLLREASMNTPPNAGATEPPNGDTSPTNDMFMVMYSELRAVAERVLGKHQSIRTVSPTMLVNEAYVKLAQGSGYAWEGQPHFLGVAAKAIRHILVDYARKRQACKGPGGKLHVEVTPECITDTRGTLDLLALNDALCLLSQVTPNGERVAQTVELRYFGGLSIEHTAQLLGVSGSTVKADWTFARAWLLAHLTGSPGNDEHT